MSFRSPVTTCTKRPMVTRSSGRVAAAPQPLPFDCTCEYCGECICSPLIDAPNDHCKNVTLQAMTSNKSRLGGLKRGASVRINVSCQTEDELEINNADPVPVTQIKIVPTFTQKWLPIVNVLLHKYKSSLLFMPFLLLVVGTLVWTHVTQTTSRADLQRITRNVGVRCEDGSQLYFVQGDDSDRLFQIEVEQDVTRVRYCTSITQNTFLESTKVYRVNAQFERNVCHQETHFYQSTIQDEVNIRINEQNEGHLLSYFIKSRNSVETEEEACTQAFRLCEPSIATNSRRAAISNHLVVDLKHCACSEALHSCLSSASLSSTLAINLGHLYFNRLRVKCFHFEYRRTCLLFMFGGCYFEGAFACHVKLKENKLF